MPDLLGSRKLRYEELFDGVLILYNRYGRACDMEEKGYIHTVDLYEVDFQNVDLFGRSMGVWHTC